LGFPDVTGFPASDSEVRDWFRRGDPTPEESGVRFSAFITVLFKTLEIIQDPQTRIRNAISEPSSLTALEKKDALQNYPGSLPGQFRLFMTVGQQFRKQGELRIMLYRRVL
jgi:hypothetical protein